MKTERLIHRRLMRLMIGDRLKTSEIPDQTIGKAVGLAVFASDALSSTAYATEEILFVLILAGTSALSLSIPISIAIAILLAIVTVSYEQTVHAYPSGGGAYIVSKENLGETAAQIASAALLTDYILTVSVSISSGVAQIVSAFPKLHPLRVEISLVLIAFMAVINLRGVKESGRAFAVPTYLFLVMTFITLGYGFLQLLGGTVRPLTGVRVVQANLHGLTAFLVLRAFSSGCTALTGMEAISNGIPAFKKPSSRNAGITMMWMSGMLVTMFLGITFLAQKVRALPSLEETIVSQLGRAIYGDGSPFTLILLIATTMILIMAANTSFADFPRLGAIQAADRFLPKQLTFRGSRLVYSYGIVALALVASLLVVAFHAETNALIPLYAIGVFLSFTLSQTGMAVHWYKSGKLQPNAEANEGSALRHDPRWRLKLIVNGFGATCTAVVTLIFAVTKFAQGAWIVVLLIPVLVAIFFRIHRHYNSVAASLSLEDFGAPPRARRHRVIVPIGGVHRGVVIALNYARSLSDDVTSVYVSLDPMETERITAKWREWGDGVRLKIIESPYRVLIETLIDYIDELEKSRRPNELLTIVVPHFIPDHVWDNALHAQTARLLRWALLERKGVVITEVPYHLGD